MKTNAIYTTFQGEVNPFGMGQPCLFLRLQGCHIRCYKTTLNQLCDTIEALKKPMEHELIGDIVAKAHKMASEHQLRVITLTGGDPLWNKEEEVTELLRDLTTLNYNVCVETSGTISWLPYHAISKNLYWVLDYKLNSCGVKDAKKLFMDKAHLDVLSPKDFIKFVVYDELDMVEAIEAIHYLKYKTTAKLAVGAYWGGSLGTLEIFNRLKEEKLLGHTVINMQTHKLVVNPDFTSVIPEKI